MDHLIEQCSGIANPARLARKFHIVVIYETFVSAARALRTCELLRQEIPPDVTVLIDAWRIESLEDSASRELAASSASRADLVIISTTGRDAPPQPLHEWMDLWLDNGIDRPTALFTLFGDHMTPASTTAARVLRQKTAPLGIDFFIHPAPDAESLQRHRSLGWQNNHIPVASTTPQIVSPPEEAESAFDTIESFAAHLRALFLDLSTADLPGDARHRVQTAF